MEAYYSVDALTGERVMHAPLLFVVRGYAGPDYEGNEKLSVCINDKLLLNYACSLIQNGPLLEDSLKGSQPIVAIRIRDGLADKIRKLISHRKFEKAAERIKQVYLSCVAEVESWEEMGAGSDSDDAEGEEDGD